VSLSVAMVAMPRRTGWVSLKVFAIMGASMAPMMGLLMNLVKLNPSYGASLIAPPMATSRPLTAPMAASVSMVIDNFLKVFEILTFTMFYGMRITRGGGPRGSYGASESKSRVQFDSKEVQFRSKEVLMLV